MIAAVASVAVVVCFDLHVSAPVPQCSISMPSRCMLAAFREIRPSGPPTPA
jgi:hypothetical protein